MDDSLSLGDGERSTLPTLDDALDALSYLRRGQWPSFRNVVQQCQPASSYLGEAARLMSALAHMDWQMSAGEEPLAVWPLRWSVSPSRIVIPEQGDAFLAGARSNDLIRRLSANVRSLGGEVVFESQATAPARIRLVGLSVGDLSLVALQTSEEASVDIAVSRQPASRLTPLLPRFGKIAAVLRRDLLPLDAAKNRFDPRSGTCSPCEAIDGPGAYRFDCTPPFWAFVSPEDARSGHGRIMDYRLAKYMAAAQAGIDLVGYDPHHATLTVPLGAQLPGLYERAAVLCSGLAPQRQQRYVVYQSVPHPVAYALADRLRSV